MSTSVSPEATFTWTERNWSMNITLNMCMDDAGHGCVCMSLSQSGGQKEHRLYAGEDILSRKAKRPLCSPSPSPGHG